MNTNDTIFVLVDVQGKLAQVMQDKDSLFENLQSLVKGVKAIGIPIIWMEQIPEKMGPTISELLPLLEGETPIPKTSFSCWGEKVFVEKLAESGRRTVVLAGIEAHVCVYQTATDLVENGYNVEIVADAVSSRSAENRKIGLDKARDNGAQITCVETLLFELLQDASHPAFRDVLKLVR